jgi:hypothetical protein
MMLSAVAGREFARSLGLGRAALALYFTPVNLMRKSISEGGPWEQWRTERGRRAMIDSAQNLAPLAAPVLDRGARVAFLSGAAHWYQTLFCFVSLQVQMRERVTPVILEDGTMTPEAREHMRRIVSWTAFVNADAIEERLDRLLPVASFPSLRARRLEYPHLRKLTDIHLGEPGWSLVMDSDMLVFRHPHALASWFDNPHAVFMQDAVDAYGYSQTLMSDLAGGRIPGRVNVGLYAIHGPSIDWHRLEYWCRIQIEREGPHYLQEQALTALLLADAGAEALPSEDYVVLPSLAEGRVPTAVLHHYVAHSKRSYFQHGWRHVLNVLTHPLQPA